MPTHSLINFSKVRLRTKRPSIALPTVFKCSVQELTCAGGSSFQAFCRSSSISANISRTSSTWIITRSQNPARSCDVVWNWSAPSCVYNIAINKITSYHVAKQSASRRQQFNRGISVVQPPKEGLRSGAGHGFLAAFATFGGCMVTLTSWFNFQHGVSYWSAIVTIAIKCTIFELWAWDR